jgi:pyrroloquinoline-quinone synthase
VSASDFEARLHAALERRYHHRHPFNLRMHAGTLSRDEIRTWVHNRYYYQTRIPIKDGLILAKAGDPAFRRGWVRRIRDHDGDERGAGGLELWLVLAEAVGLPRAEVESLRDVLPGVKRAGDDYVRFVESHDLLASVASSLTELRAGGLMRERIEAFEKHYPWVDTQGLRYFESRTQQAPRDAAEGLRFVLEHARGEDEQARCVAAVERKCEILWQLLDAIDAAGSPARISQHAQLRDDPGGTLVVLPERAVRPSESGREILALCDGTHSAVEIVRVLKARHPDVPELAADVHEFLSEMERLGVLAPRLAPA